MRIPTWLRAAIHVTMGNVLDGADDLEGAMACYRACLAVAEEDAEDPDTQHVQMALTNMGVALHRRARWDDAIADLELALTTMKDSVEVRRTLAEAYRRVGRRRLAELQDREADRVEAAQKARRGKRPAEAGG